MEPTRYVAFHTRSLVAAQAKQLQLAESLTLHVVSPVPPQRPPPPRPQKPQSGRVCQPPQRPQCPGATHGR
jgi:hypothetical protein